MKYLIGTFLISATLNAAVNCYGVPTSVKVGEYGAQENYLIVSIGGKDYRLGYFDDPKAKLRFSLAQSAQLSNRELMLSFYGETACADASLNRTVPNSTKLR